jgi:hypothetical protein
MLSAMTIDQHIPNFCDGITPQRAEWGDAGPAAGGAVGGRLDRILFTEPGIGRTTMQEREGRVDHFRGK